MCNNTLAHTCNDIDKDCVGVAFSFVIMLILKVVNSILKDNKQNLTLVVVSYEIYETQ